MRQTPSKFAIGYSQNTNSDLTENYVIKTPYFGNQQVRTLSKGGLHNNGARDVNVLCCTKTHTESQLKLYSEAKSLVYSTESGLILRLNENTTELLKNDKRQKYHFALGTRNDSNGGYSIDDYSDVLVVDHDLVAASSLEDLTTFGKKLVAFGVGL